MIQAECPGCGSIQDLPDAAAGCVGSCQCGRKFRIGGAFGPAVTVGDKAGCAPMLVEGIFTFGSLGFLGGLGKTIARKGSGSLFLSLSVGITLWVLVFAIGGWAWVIGPIAWGIFVFGKFPFDLISAAA